jgi:hypothetical protein
MTLPGLVDWTAGEKPTAAKMDGMSRQTVMFFLTAAARDAAITAPEEGMHAFLADTDSLTHYDGAAWQTRPDPAVKRVRVATTAAGTLATSFENGDTIDGVVLATGDHILIKDQAAGAENGTYVVNASGAPTRAGDFDTSAKVVPGTLVVVSEGTSNKDSHWQLTTNAPITLGTTALVFFPTHMQGTGAPDGVVTAPIGAKYHRIDGGAGTTMYAKESGTGNTGWNTLGGGAGQGVPTGGTKGQVLRKLSATNFDTEWGKPVGWEHIERADGSAAATLDISLPTGWLTFMLVIHEFDPVSGSELRARFGLNGTFAAGATDYAYLLQADVDTTADNTYVSDNSSGADHIRLTTAQSAGSAERGFGELFVRPFHSASRRASLWGQGVSRNSNISRWNVCGGRTGSAEVNQIRLYFATGNIDSLVVDVLGSRNPTV